RVAEVCGLRARGVGVHQLRIAGQNQQRRKARGDNVSFAGPKVGKVELVEFSPGRQGQDSNPERQFRCIVSSQEGPTAEPASYTKRSRRGISTVYSKLVA